MPKDGPQASRLTAKEICSIIKASKDAGLYSIEFGDLKIRFWAEVQQIPRPIHVPKAMLERQHAVAEEALEKEEILTREDQLAELLLTDPAAFERHQTSDDVDSEKDSEADADTESAGYLGAE